MATQQQGESYSAHVLPPYFEKIQRYLVLPLLLLAEFYVNGLLSVRGIVANLAAPDTWDWYGWVGVAIMFVAIGLACAGIAVGLSGRCAEAFALGRWYAFPLLLGVVVFAGVEFYAGISERSVNLVATPADTAVGQVIGLALSAATPASIMASIILPVATIFYGFALKPPQVETDAARKERHAAKLAEAQYQADLRRIKAAGLAGAARAATQAAFGAKDASLPGEDAQASGDNLPPDDGGNVSLIGGKDGRVIGGKDARSGKAGNGRGGLSVVNKNLLTADDLRQSLARDNHVFISEADALAFVKAQPSAERVMGIQGQPWAANKAATLQRARAKFASGNMAEEPAL